MRDARKRFLLLRVLIGAAVIAPAAAARAADETDSALLERQTQELMGAVTSGTAAVWERYLDPAAVYVDESGNVSTKKEMVDGIKPLAAGVSGVIRVTGFRAVVSGDLAVATHVDDENENYHGHPLHCQYRTTDTWRKTPDGWRLAGGQVLALKSDPPSAPIAESLRREYCGRYSLTPEIAYEIRLRGDALEGERTGRKAETLLGEAPDVLFVPGEPRYRKIFRRGPDGKVTGFMPVASFRRGDAACETVPPRPHGGERPAVRALIGPRSEPLFCVDPMRRTSCKALDTTPASIFQQPATARRPPGDRPLRPESR